MSGMVDTHVLVVLVSIYFSAFTSPIKMFVCLMFLLCIFLPIYRASVAGCNSQCFGFTVSKVINILPLNKKESNRTFLNHFKRSCDFAINLNRHCGANQNLCCSDIKQLRWPTTCKDIYGTRIYPSKTPYRVMPAIQGFDCRPWLPL